ncbi:MAG: fatty-acid metabolism regulator protein, partial [Candidatus Eremiobacteraeota bacterium]|nr:fatty-acid metabolism regulator protein [Candidatus Eremiobacteraeota bacterium]
LGFANKIADGPVGMVGASGTGMQEIACLLSRMGIGLSHGIGTGSRDVKSEVGGITFMMGIEMLMDDPETEVIILVSKPPDREVEENILGIIKGRKKPVIVCFLGSEPGESFPGVYHVETLEEAASKTAELLEHNAGIPVPEMDSAFESRLNNLDNSRKYLRGLYSGGTLASEAEMLLRPVLPGLLSNISKRDEYRLPDPWKSPGNCIVDMGEDIFTRGRPHPMIDLSLRLARMKEEAEDPYCAVILFDLVLGYGAHPDPAKEMEETLREINSMDGGPLVIASLCGVPDDPQDAIRQEELLRDCGIIVFYSSASASRFAGKIMRKVLGRTK